MGETHQQAEGLVQMLLICETEVVVELGRPGFDHHLGGEDQVHPVVQQGLSQV